MESLKLFGEALRAGRYEPEQGNLHRGPVLPTGGVTILPDWVIRSQASTLFFCAKKSMGKVHRL